MSSKKIYLVKSNIDLILNFFFLTNIPAERYEIERFYVFKDTEDKVLYESINNSFYIDGTEVNSDKFLKVSEACDEDMFDCTGKIRFLKYVAKIKDSFYELYIFNGHIDGLVLLSSDIEITYDELKHIIVRDVSNEEIYTKYLKKV